MFNFISYAFAFLVLLAGCSDETTPGGAGGQAGAGGVGGGGAGGDALNPCTLNGVVLNVPVNPERAMDLLIVIDDSPSMRDEQEKLREQVPRLVNLLLSGGAAAPEVVGEFPAIKSLHVGIITPDLGHSTAPPHSFAAGSGPGADFNPSSACMTNSGSGKAGFMQVEGLSGTTRTMCTAVTPPEGTLYLSFPEPGFTEANLTSDLSCLIGQEDGCGFEQQLESILVSDRNTANGGFRRDRALLTVILITDEDDCSTTDPRVFDIQPRASNPFQGPFTSIGELQFNLRCWAHRDALRAIEDYVDGVAALRPDPSQVVFAAITGMPQDSALDRHNFNSDEDRYKAILAADDMTELPDPAASDTQGQQLRAACNASDGSGSATPGRRIVETMEGLASGSTGVSTAVESICAADYTPAVNAILDQIAAALRQICLPRPFNRNSVDLIGCEVREVQPEGGTCATAGRGREEVAVGIENGREVCRVAQLSSDPAAGVPTGLGWFYDDFTPEMVSACTFNPEQQRVSFTEGAAPMAGARIRLECVQAALPTTEDVGWPCNDAADDGGADTICNPQPEDCLDGESPEGCETRILEERYDRDNLRLTCDGETSTCQLSCTSNVQCPGGFSCNDASGDGIRYCVSPTCTLN